VTVYKSRRKSETTVKALRFAMIAILCIPIMLPLLWMISTALKSNTAIFQIPPEWIPKEFHWDNFSTGLNKIDFWQRFAISTVIAVIVTIGQVCSCMCVGYALARLKFPGKKVWFYLIIGSMMIPGMVTMIPIFRFWVSVNAYGTYWPLIIPAFLGGPFQTFLARQFLTGIPKSYDEAARIDGANRLQILVKVIAPMSKPLITVIAIQAFQGAWNDYMGPLIYLLQKPEKWTLALAVGRMTSSTYGTQWNLFMAADVIYMLPILILFFFCQKYFMQGLGSMNNAGVK
jgi:multiple sugar transport system permease protein